MGTTAQMPAYNPARYGGVAAGGYRSLPACDAIATRLMAAENPIALTGLSRAQCRGGRGAGAPRAFLRHPDRGVQLDRSQCFAGFTVLCRFRSDAFCWNRPMLGLLLDTDVPFVPQYANASKKSNWIQIDIDPLKSDFPMWGFPTDIRVQADCADGSAAGARGGRGARG
jgi:acetolactate synthase-1/2/3 large subunit